MKGPTGLRGYRTYNAELAGKRPEECTLIVTEGDSAKALAVAGLEASFV